jgi:hypothetical protein
MSSLCRGSIVAGKKALLAPTGAVDAADRFLGLSRSPSLVWSPVAAYDHWRRDRRNCNHRFDIKCKWPVTRWRDTTVNESHGSKEHVYQTVTQTMSLDKADKPPQAGFEEGTSLGAGAASRCPCAQLVNDCKGCNKGLFDHTLRSAIDRHSIRRHP